MSTIIIRPSALLNKDGTIEGTSNTGSTWATATDANVASYTADESDATGIRTSGATTRWFQVRLGTPTIATDEFVAKVAGLVRWSSATAGKTVACLPYVTANGTPGYSSGLTTTVAASPVTAETGVQALAWTKGQVADLGLQISLDGDATAANRPKLWELGATIYTLKLATATPAAATITTGTIPTISVDVAATIGWEASTPDWQGLRKITTEIRVESGGTTVGTGTLVTASSRDVYFTATGTQTISVTMPDSLANGSYKVYARAVRHRQSETSIASDQYGAWSTAATLTMSVTPPATPTVTVTVDQVNDTVAVAVTPVASTGYTVPSVVVQRSDDGGLTWATIRDGLVTGATFGAATTVVDYEAPRAATVYYRAGVFAYYSGVLNQSAWSTRIPTTIPADAWNIKSPQVPSINWADVIVTGELTDQVSEDLGVFRPLDRRYPVTVAGTLTGWDGDLTIHCANNADWTKLRTLIESQLVLRLESPFGWSKYVRILPGSKARLYGTASTPRRDVVVQYVETSAPVGTAPEIPTVLVVSVDAGAAATSTWDEIADGGTASTVTFAGTLEGGSAA